MTGGINSLQWWGIRTDPKDASFLIDIINQARRYSSLLSSSIHFYILLPHEVPCYMIPLIDLSPSYHPFSLPMLLIPPLFFFLSYHSFPSLLSSLFPPNPSLPNPSPSLHSPISARQQAEEEKQREEQQRLEALAQQQAQEEV